MTRPGRAAVSGRVVLRVRAGEDPADVPHHGDVVIGAAHALGRFDGGRVERALRRFTPAMRVSRVFHAASALGDLGKRHQGWDDLEVRTGLSRTYRVDVDPEVDLPALLSALRDLDAVEMAGPHYLSVTPFSAAPAVAVPAARTRRRARVDLWYGHRMVGAREALAREPGDSALIVGVLDSGVDLEHPEFEGRLRPGVDAVNLPEERVPGWIRFTRASRPRRSRPADDMGHGTATSAIIGAVGRHVPRGLSGAARLLPVRVLAGARLGDGEKPTAVGSIPDIDAGVKTAVDLGARVLNLSFGTPESALGEGDPIPHQEIVRYALARGCALVAAAGNTGDSTRFFPAALPGVLAVGAVGPSGVPAPFSTRGAHVALCAPGERIPSAALGGYQLNTGTSFAAPFVTAACALLIACAARNSRPVDWPSLRKVLVQSAQPFGRGANTSGCGAGILDLPAALRALESLLETDGPLSSDVRIGGPP